MLNYNPFARKHRKKNLYNLEFRYNKSIVYERKIDKFHFFFLN